MKVSLITFFLLLSISAQAMTPECFRLLRSIFSKNARIGDDALLYQHLSAVEGPVAASFSQPFHLQLEVYSDESHRLESYNQRHHSRVIVYRFDKSGAGLKDAIPSVGTHEMNLSSNHIIELDRQIHDELYNEYASQGPERNLEIENYRAEDKLTTANTTHFLVASPDEFYYQNVAHNPNHPVDAVSAASHVQIQVSEDPSLELNTERHSGKIPRPKGQRWGDLGRGLNISDGKIPIEIQNTLNKEISRRERFTTVLRQALGWGNNFAKLDRLVFQVNEDVLEIMRSLWGDQAIVKRVSTHVHGHEALEWIVTMNKKQMQTAEKIMAAQSVLNQINKGFERIALRAADGAQGLRLLFQPTDFERPAFEKIISQPLAKKFPKKKYFFLKSNWLYSQASESALGEKELSYLREYLKEEVKRLKVN